MADATSSDDDEQRSFVQKAYSTAIAPVQLATSRPAIKAYLSTVLFLVTSIILFSVSTIAYLFFYYTYIPQINLSHIIYLQYGAGSYPHATTILHTNSLISQQPYDIEIHLHLPRTPNNLAAGNFMLDLALLVPSTDPVSTKLTSVLPNASSLLPYTTIASSRRPAILPYASPLLSLASTMFSLPLHLLSIRDLDAKVLKIPMFELLSFARGSRNVPTAIYLELQSEEPLQVYSVSISFKAKFEGLRYVIYNFRILSFLAFSGVFYSVSLSSMGIAWAVVTWLFGSSKKELEIKTEAQTRPRIKTEPNDDEKAQQSNGHVKSEPRSSSQSIKGKERDKILLNAPSESDSSDHGLSVSNLSDTATTFPTTGRQMPLRYPVKTYGEQKSSGDGGPATKGDQSLIHIFSSRNRGNGRPSRQCNRALLPAGGTGIPTTDEVADDEDDVDTEIKEEEEDADAAENEGLRRRRGRSRSGDDVDFRDSGVGTSMESENPTLGRRKSYTGERGGRGGSGSRSRFD